MQAFKLIPHFIQSVCSHWGTLMTGGIVWAGLLVYTRYTGHDVPPYVFWGVTVLFGVAAFFLAWKDESMARDRAALRVAELEDQLKPKLAFVLRDGCCRFAATMMIGVGNEGSKTVHDASVYVDIPSLGITDKVLKWATPERPEKFDLHPSGHHHTDHFASVGDVGDKFYFQFGYGNLEVPPGTYVVALCVKGRDVTAATAKMQVVFTSPRSYRAQLLGGQPVAG